MKKIVFCLFMASISVVSFANDPVTAKMKYHVVNNAKMFGSQWFEDAQLGFMNLGLVWDKYDQSVHEGFILESAATVKFISPELPADCSIKSLKGTLNWMEKGTSPVGITVTGKGCQSFIEDAKNVRIEIKFTNVQHQNGTSKTPVLLLQITETP